MQLPGLRVVLLLPLASPPSLDCLYTEPLQPLDTVYLAFEGEEQRTENDPFSWEDFFPSEPKPQAPAMPVEKSEKKIEKDKIAPAELLIREDSSPKVPEIVTENVNKTTPKKSVVIDDAYNNTQDNADLLPYGTEELRKAVIASEILAKKF